MVTRTRKAVASLWATGLWLGLGVASQEALAQKSVGAESFGASVNTAAVSQPKTPLAVLDPAVGLADTAIASLSVTSVIVSDPILGTMSTSSLLNAKGLDATAGGAVGENAATSQGGSTLANVNILNGVVTAEAVVASASSASNGVTATSSNAGSRILGLAINGVFMGDVVPAPNTTINVPGVGTVILNEQFQSGDGIKTSGLQVNMIHVVLKDALTGAKTGDIIVGSAKSSVGFAK